MKSLPQSYTSDSQLPSVLLVQLSHLKKNTDKSKFKDFHSWKDIHEEFFNFMIELDT